MKVFETGGRFWLPASPDEVMPGRLRWERDGGSELSISGSLHGDVGKEHTVIHGLVENTPNSLGRSVTLWHAHCFGRNFSSIGLTRERYHAQALLSGQLLDSESEVLFKSTELRFSVLDSWAEGFTGLGTRDRVEGGKLRFEHYHTNPEPLEIPCDGFSLGLHTTATSSQTYRHYQIQESAVFVVNPEQPLRLTQLNDQFVYPLQNFLTFAMNTPASVERWVNHLPNESPEQDDFRDVDVSYRRYFSGPETKKDDSRLRPLFTLGNVAERLPDVFSAWFRACKRFQHAFNLYFGVQYTRKLFTDWRLQTVVHALTLYAQPDGPRPAVDERLQAILEDIGEQNAKYLIRLLSTSMLLNAEAALSTLMEEHGAEVEWLFGRSPQAFIGRVTNTLHYLMRRESTDVFAASQSNELYYLTATLGWLMKLCLLKEIGCARDDRKRLIEGNVEAQGIHVFWTRQAVN